jgi:hypothetical protein
MVMRDAFFALGCFLSGLNDAIQPANSTRKRLIFGLFLLPPSLSLALSLARSLSASIAKSVLATVQFGSVGRAVHLHAESLTQFDLEEQATGTVDL